MEIERSGVKVPRWCRLVVRLVLLALVLTACSSGHPKSTPTTAATTGTTMTPSTVAQSSLPTIRSSTTSTIGVSNGTTPADNAINPKITVIPDQNLVDGETVIIKVTGFGSGGSYGFLSARLPPT
jgi:hypothetical protein